MTITDRMVSVKNRLIEADREAAIEVVTEYIYHTFNTRVSGTDRSVLFENDGYIHFFHTQKQVDETALQWLLEKMKEEGIVEFSDKIIYLTELGIKKLCEIEN